MIDTCSVAIVANGGEHESALGMLQRAGLVPSDAEITHFDVAYTALPQDGAPQRRHLLWDKAEASFDLVVCSKSIRFFESLWGRAFVTLLMRNCRRGGLIVVPRGRGAQNSPGLYLSPVKLESLLGKGDTETVPDFVCFRRPETIDGDVPSMLLWSASHIGDESIRKYVADKDATDPSLVKHLSETGSPIEIDPDFEADFSRDAEFGARSDVFGDATSLLLRTFTYWIGGLAYKTPAVTDVARLCGLRSGATLVDYGAGVGQLAVDCVLDPDCPIDHATAVDLSPGNALIFDRIARDLRPALQDRVRFVAGSFARWLSKEPVDMISCIGALLYLPRADVDATLSRWWRLLKPGGVLLIHENIRQPNTPPSRDRDRMFDDHELTAALQRLGQQRFFGTAAMRELSPSAAAGKSAFRFVQKAT
jgi:ubiquinone/menaquinone biosynthesis C-methylase UbiE